MASFTITLVPGSACSGGEHARVRVQASTPAIDRIIPITRTGVNEAVDADRLADAVEVLLRFLKADDGLTAAQLAAKVATGITVTLA